ncbi:MAG: TRAP transporter substrate-binding protein [Burkholderiaceae bacterium]|nr:TRAP transporter substrate-binding protein [Burkholderiaceae bacterium]
MNTRHNDRIRCAGRRRVAIAVLAAATLPGFSAAQAQPKELVFAISAAPGSLQQETAAEFTRRVNARLAGKAAMKLFDNSQLGKDQDLMQKLKLGSVHVSMPSSIMASIADEFALYELPFLVKDRSHVAAINEKIFWPQIAPKAEAKGYKVLGVWENGVRHITNSKRPINTPADLAGLKIRVPQSKWRVMMFERWGANPTPMAFSEVFVALQTGVMDGQENPNTNVWGAKFHEVQKYLSLTSHVYTPSFATVGKAVFDKLDPEIQKALSDTAREMEVWAREKGAAEDAELEAKLKAGGMQVNVANRASFVTASKPIYDEFAKALPSGKGMIDTALKLAD